MRKKKPKVPYYINDDDHKLYDLMNDEELKEYYRNILNLSEITKKGNKKENNNENNKEMIDPPKIKYQYDEDLFLEELRKHIDLTNKTHYSGEIQPTEFIMSHAETLDFLVGNVIKYTFRYGKKRGYNKEDLFKACHYLMMMHHFAEGKIDPKKNPPF